MKMNSGVRGTSSDNECISTIWGGVERTVLIHRWLNVNLQDTFSLLTLFFTLSKMPGSIILFHPATGFDPNDPREEKGN